MLSGFNGKAERTGAETGGFAEKNDIAERNHLLVAFDPVENAVRSDLNSIFKLFSEPFDSGFGIFTKRIADRDKFSVRIGFEGIDQSAAPTAAATDQTNFECVALIGVNSARSHQHRSGRGTHRTRFDEITT